MTPPSGVTQTTVPPEAHNIANDFRRAATRARQLAQDIRSIRSVLDSDWEGNAKQNFMRDFAPCPDQLEAIANQLEDAARRVQNIRVKA